MLVALGQMGAVAAPPGPKAPGTAGGGRAHLLNHLMLESHPPCWNDSLLVNMLEIPTIATLMVSPTGALAAQMVMQ